MTASSRMPRASRTARTGFVGLLVGLLIALSGCSPRPVTGLAAASGSAGTSAPSQTSQTSQTAQTAQTGPNASMAAAGRVTGPAGLCPPAPTPQTEHVKVDYVDFLRWDGRTYTRAASFGAARLSTIPTAATTDLGPDVFRVTCALAHWNDITDAMPVPADGDAAFLVSGTPVAAVKGWPIECRLVARTASGLVVYLADGPNRQALAPDPCATAPSTR